MLSLNQKKIISYYSLGAASLLLIFKIYFSSSFSSFVDYFIAFVACVVVIAMTIRGVVNYHKDHDNLKKVVHNMLVNTLALLAITLITYILYSPRIMTPLVKLVRNLKEYISLENYFLLALYVCLFTIAIAIINLLIKTYLRARGSYSGSIRRLAKDTLYTVFFIFAVLFSLSIAAYSEAYGPITEFASRAIYNTFLDSGATTVYNTGTRGVSSLKEAVNETIKNISENVSDSQEKLATNITETKETLTEAIGGTSDELKSDIDTKLNVKGGKLKGDLTVNGTLYAEDIIPGSNSTYDLGSSSKAWNALYVQSINYSGGVISLESNKITNLADPTSAQDAATKSYVDAQISASPQVFSKSGTTLSPTTSGDSLNMANAVIANIGNAGTDFTASGGLNLAGVLTTTSTSTHTLGSVTITGGAIAGATNINMSGTLDLGTNTLADGELTGNWDFNSGDISGVDNLIVSGSLSMAGNRINNLADPASAQDAATRQYVDDAVDDAAMGTITNLTLAGNLTLSATTATTGIIYAGAIPFIHNYGTNNTFVGENAGNFTTTLLGNNTALGYQALVNITTGTNNTASGSQALINNINGSDNTAVGAVALYSNTNGYQNTASGYFSLYSNVGGFSNTAYGAYSLYRNGSGNSNTSIGSNSMYENTKGTANVAVGNSSLLGTTVGSKNTALGSDSLISNTIGAYNTAVGYRSGYSNSIGSYNVFLGYNAGYSETGSDKLYIDNSNTTTPLIYGDFSTNSLIFTGAAGAVTLDIDSNETTADNNIFTVSSDVGGADDLKFKVQADGDIYGDGTQYNQGADYAEYFQSSDKDLSSGELVCINTANNNLIERCKRTKDINAIGIISSNPAFVGNNIHGAEANLGEEDDSYKLVGLIGQVKTKVTNENGVIASGDSLTAATKPGYAMKADAGDTTVGVALESSEKEDDTITVLISRKNKSLTVEQVEAETERRIAEMEIEDDVNALIDDQLASVETETGKLKTDLASLTTQLEEYDSVMATIQEQIEELKDLTSDELILAQIDLNKNDIDFIKLTLGTDRVKNPEDVDILGQLSVKEISAGVYVVTNDQEAPTIGTATITVGETEIIVETSAIKEESRIFVTPLAEEPVLWSVAKKTKGESFTLKINEAAESDLEFDWWLVEED